MEILSPQFSFVTREESWKKISQQKWDVVIIGGGITGAACARDAQLRGLKVLLVEADDFASGTSSGSSKLIHGGVRYLKNAEFKLVYTAIQERERLTKLYAPFVKPIPFVFPTYTRKFPPRWMLNMGLHMYDAFSGFNEHHENLNRKRSIDRYPLLEDKGLTGSIVYRDAFAEDFRLVVEIVKAAHRVGATCLNRVAAVSFENLNPGFRTRLQNRLTGEECQVESKLVINCAGPFSDSIRRLLQLPEKLYLTQGVHFLVPHNRFPIREAYVISDPQHDRILFAIPWNSATYFGTTDTPVKEVKDARASSEDLDYVIREVNKAFNLPLRREDVFQSWAAVRPLIKPPHRPDGAKSVSKVSREHEILEEPEGFFHVLGGKLTSHREMAEEAIDKLGERISLARECQTREQALQGQFFESEATELEQRYGIFTPDIDAWNKKKNLNKMKITSDLSFQVAEIYYAIHHEMALEPIDFLRRRSSLFYERTDPKIIEAVTRIFKQELQRDEAWYQAQLKSTQKIYAWDSEGFK